ncbi:MAG: J domain-containing protein [Jaaginema sp. PMC 1079.18]|nr:J domain-containing protein [Jaaginema sp. PMC 1080.18]MEC4853378.1 J domain-containing protein [Jaaginema sp. PMC 1079.18]MEC4866749.1 J domain-containing protein [Jaaginema sp. PMC 1078.18]
MFSSVAIATTAERIILLPPFLFSLVICTASLLVSRSSSETPPTLNLDPNPEDETQTSYPWACCLEDAPATVLQGQAYDWATPLLSPLACLLEDIPEKALSGQAYDWATPLLSPLACLLEDIPEKALCGQAYDWAIPLLSPLACVVDAGWSAFYRERLGQKGVHYWEWRNFPLVEQVSPELLLLLDLPEPTGATREILAQLTLPSHTWPLRDRQQFQVWHNIALSRYGKTRLSAIYQICYSTPWDEIEVLTALANTAILDPQIPWWQVLGVSATARPSQVDQAYKKQLKRWHPDINPHEEATLIAARINIAYEEFKLSQTVPKRPLRPASSKNLLDLLQKGFELLRRR